MTQPLCRYCGGPIRKRTVVNWIEKPGSVDRTDSSFARHIRCEAPPTDIAGCRRLTNETVVSVQRGINNTIRSFGTWDGKSYIDPYFCNGEHARLFGYVMAKVGKCTTDYVSAVEQRGEKVA